MKSYLALVPQYERVHRKSGRMSVLCIVFSVLLVTAIFSMVDMALRAQKSYFIKTNGEYHASVILCDTTLPDGSGLDLLHSQRNLAERYGALVKSRPLFILTDSRDLATEYQYRQEGVNDYLTPPVNIPELIRRICYFVFVTR